MSQLQHFQTRAHAALVEQATSPHHTTVRQWYAVGDPQTSLLSFAGALEANGLLGPDGWLLPDVGLISMGDHFDYGAPRDADDPANRDAAGREGQLILAWLAAHAPDQTVILLGNHDAARVMELHAFDDASFREARAESYRMLPEEEADFVQRYLLPSSGLVRRDFSTFTTAQQRQVQKFLLDGRMRLSHIAQHEGEVCLFTHAGVTRRELSLLQLGEAANAPEVHAALSKFLDAAIAEVARAWRSNVRAALSLAPLHVDAVPGAESGGLLAHRPSNPNRESIRDPAWEWDPERPRRFSPLSLPLGFDQAVGHTGKNILQRELVPWNEDVVFVPGELHTLHFGVERNDVGMPRLLQGISDHRLGARRLFLLDPSFAHLEAEQSPKLFRIKP